jgi:hypothetical protein
MEVCDQDGHLEPRLLQVHQLVDGDEMPEVNITARFIARIDPFYGPVKERPELGLGDDLYRIPCCQ